MDDEIITTAHHETGHALMAHIVGWSIKSIDLDIQNGTLKRGVTHYDFGGDELNNWTNINRRVFCSLGGPIAQAIHQDNNIIDIDTLGEDGIFIDKLLSILDSQSKSGTIQSSINSTATILELPANRNAMEQIVERLINNLTISQADFLEIVNANNVQGLTF